MTITLSIGLLALIAVRALLFALVTAFCWRAGMFDGGGALGGIDVMFALLFYGGGWLFPTLVLALVWALWGRAA
jgi:hypothetical protein